MAGDAMGHGLDPRCRTGRDLTFRAAKEGLAAMDEFRPLVRVGTTMAAFALRWILDERGGGDGDSRREERGAGEGQHGGGRTAGDR